MEKKNDRLPDSETLTSDNREPVGFSHKNGGYRGKGLPNTDELWKIVDRKVFLFRFFYFCHLKRVKKRFHQNRSIYFFFLSKFFLFFKAHSYLWKYWKSFFFLETYFFPIVLKKRLIKKKINDKKKKINFKKTIKDNLKKMFTFDRGTCM